MILEHAHRVEYLCVGGLWLVDNNTGEMADAKHRVFGWWVDPTIKCYLRAAAGISRHRRTCYVKAAKCPMLLKKYFSHVKKILCTRFPKKKGVRFQVPFATFLLCKGVFLNWPRKEWGVGHTRVLGLEARNKIFQKVVMEHHMPEALGCTIHARVGWVGYAKM